MTTDPGSGLPASGAPPSTQGPPQSPSVDAEAAERLQAMLAQASQGQRDEQREITRALGDLRNQLLRLGQEIAELRAARPAEPVDSGAINTVTVELREAVRFLSERLDGVARMITQRGEELADVRTALTAIDAHIRSQAETLGVLSTGLQALPSYGERVSALQEHIAGVAQRIGGIEAAVSRPPDSGVNNRLAAIEASLSRPADSDLGDRLTAIEAAIAPLSQHLAETGRVASDHSAAMAETTASLQALHSKVESLAAGTQAALATPASIDDSAISALDQRMAAVASDLTALSREVANLVAGSRSEPTPDGISAEHLDQAMRDAEVRLRSHVDDAVIALAEALLRPRTAVAPGGSPTTPAAPAAPLVAAPFVSTSPSTEPTPDSSDAGSGEPEAQWWEREEFTAPALSSAAIPSLHDEIATEDAGAIDFSQAEMADEDDAADMADMADMAPEDAEDAEDDDDEAVDGSDFELPPLEADDSLSAPPPVDSARTIPALPSLPSLPPLLADPNVADAASWSPEVPGSRPDTTDPAADQPPGTVIPEHKRRFFRR